MCLFFIYYLCEKYYKPIPKKKSIINLFQYSTIGPIVLAEYLGLLCWTYEQMDSERNLFVCRGLTVVGPPYPWFHLWLLCILRFNQPQTCCPEVFIIGKYPRISGLMRSNPRVQGSTVTPPCAPLIEEIRNSGSCRQLGSLQSHLTQLEAGGRLRGAVTLMN